MDTVVLLTLMNNIVIRVHLTYAWHILTGMMSDDKSKHIKLL